MGVFYWSFILKEILCSNSVFFWRIILRIGKCLCGESQVTIPILCTKVGICHCSMCRKMSSGPWMGIQSPIEATRFSGDNIITYHSSKFACRKFCAKCGSSLTHEPKHTPYIVVSAGIFNDQNDLIVSHEIYSDRKPKWYDFAANSDRTIMTKRQTILHYLPKMIVYGIQSRIKSISKYLAKNN